MEEVIIIYRLVPEFVSWPIIFISNVLLYLFLKKMIPYIWDSVSETFDNWVTARIARTYYFHRAVYGAKADSFDIGLDKSLMDILTEQKKKNETVEKDLTWLLKKDIRVIMLVKVDRLPSLEEFSRALKQRGIIEFESGYDDAKHISYKGKDYSVTIYPDRCVYWGKEILHENIHKILKSLRLTAQLEIDEKELEKI